MEQRSIPSTPQLTTNEKIRKLAEANPYLADVLKSEFPEVFQDEYLSFEYVKGLPDGVYRIELSADSAGVEEWQGLYVNEKIEVIVKPLQSWDNATAVLFKIKK